jgi:SAM-dependent methyltransferase
VRHRGGDVLLEYMARAPFALAFERTLESRLYLDFSMARPILDLGCGEGLFAKLAFGEKIDTGVDPDGTEIERARASDAYVELIRCAGDAVPKPDGAFRTIFANSVLEHIPRLEPVLREMHRLLAPGGRFYFTVPSDLFSHYTVGNQVLLALRRPTLAAKFRAFFDRFWRHYHCYAEAEWRKLTAEAGFEVVDSFTYDPKRICVLNDLLAPFGAPALVLRRFTDRWTLLPSARRIAVYPVYLLARQLLRSGHRSEAGGLVFVAATKPGRA